MAEQIVMTPKCKTANSTTLIIERKRQPVGDTANGDEKDVYVAGGSHKGIVINKCMTANDDNVKPAQLSLQFIVFLVSAQSGEHTQEQRTLKFWFPEDLPRELRTSAAEEFFKELVSPQEFPRNYVGFIQKIMKLLQLKYPTIDRIEVELKQIEKPVEFPVRPLSTDETILGGAKVVELTTEKVLELIESAYPNPLTIQDLAEDHGWDADAVAEKLTELEKKGLVVAVDNGAFTRVVHKDIQLRVVQRIPTMTRAKQPTIAIITAQYCEKLAVDSMIENKETFVRYSTIGESNVYTLGDIGGHRVVCTKLPTVGHTREAMIVAGNTTTRLLGTFLGADFVFIVGVGGGVPNYMDYKRHVRRGDVVISCPTKASKFVYTYCEKAQSREDGSYEFVTKEYCPANLGLQDIASNIKAQVEASDGFNPPWQRYLREGFKKLADQSEHNFEAPPVESDKLYMNIGDRDVIEVAHPNAPAGDAAYARDDGCPRIHLSPVASGRRVATDDVLREKFSSRFGNLAFDAEMDAVMEGIIGNCCDSFAVVRGIADYKDGSRSKDWQPYAALAAASVVKAMICAMDPPSSPKK